MSDSRLWLLKYTWCRRFRFDMRARMRAAMARDGMRYLRN